MTLEELLAYVRHAEFMVKVRPEGADKDLARAFLKLAQEKLNSVRF